MEPTKNKVKYTSTTIALKAIPRSWVCLQFLLLLIILFATINTSLAGEKKIVAITAIVEHPSLVQAKNGIIDELQENGYEIGKNLEIIDKNAQGAIANAILIAKKLISDSSRDRVFDKDLLNKLYQNSFSFERNAVDANSYKGLARAISQLLGIYK